MIRLKVLFILFSILDVASTYVALQSVYIEEGNPIMAAVWEETGLIGLIVTKFISCYLILALINYAEDSFPKSMFGTLLFMDVLLGVVICSNFEVINAISQIP
jgi:cell division protein FtsW (lipid II flippase)